MRLPYHPALPGFMRQLGGRYHKEQRSWSVPLTRAFPLPHVLETLYPQAPFLQEVRGVLRELGVFSPEDLRQALKRVLDESEFHLLPEQKSDLVRLFLAAERALKDPEAPRGFLLACGTGTGKTYVYSAFASAWSRLGPVLVVVPNEELARKVTRVLRGFGGEGVEVTTYGRLGRYRGFSGLLVLDEAHMVKNVVGAKASARGKEAKALIAEAPFTLFVSATPFDRPWEAAYMAPVRPHSLTKDSSFQAFLERFGVRFRQRSFGGNEPYFAGTLEDLRSFYRTLTAGGFMTKRLFRPPPGLVTYEAPKLALPKEGASLIREARKRLKEVSREALPEERGLVLSFRENLSRALLERLKLTASLPFIHELLEEGWHVALFLAYRQERLLDFSTPESVTSFLEASRLRGNKGVLAPYVVQALSGLTLAMENPMETLRESFAHLGEELAFYTGAQSQGELRRALEAWDEGKVRLLVLTQAKGGVGLSLHDTRGGRPTAQVVLTLPWTAIDLDQVLGRVVRVGLKSPVKVVLPLAPMAVEAKLGAVIAQRLKVLGYAVRGGELSLPKELLDAFEYGLAHLDPEGMERAVLGEEALV